MSKSQITGVFCGGVFSPLMGWSDSLVDSLLGFGPGVRYPVRAKALSFLTPLRFGILTLNKGGPPIELPYILSTRVQEKTLLMTYPGKSWRKDSVDQFLHHSAPLFCHGDKKGKEMLLVTRCGSGVWLTKYEVRVLFEFELSVAMTAIVFISTNVWLGTATILSANSGCNPSLNTFLKWGSNARSTS